MEVFLFYTILTFGLPIILLLVHFSFVNTPNISAEKDNLISSIMYHALFLLIFPFFTIDGASNLFSEKGFCTYSFVPMLFSSVTPC